MTKLIEQFRNDRTNVKLAVRIRTYARKHPMTACLVTLEQADLLADAIHLANREG
jgi:hypothetical protein